MRKCFASNKDLCLALWQIHSTPIGPEPPSPTALMLNRPIRGIMPKLGRPPMLFDYDDDHYTALIER